MWEDPGTDKTDETITELKVRLGGQGNVKHKRNKLWQERDNTCNTND